MKIAVMSDTHDHLENIEKAVAMINDMGADMLVHCGDLCSPFVIDRLAEFYGPVHIVFGNNDGDRITIDKFGRRFENITIHGIFGRVETARGDIAITHWPEFAAGLASTGDYRAVFSGHTHIRTRTDKGDSVHINPGDMMGLMEKPGFAVFDMESGDLENISL